MVAIWMGVSYAAVAVLAMAACLTLLLDNAKLGGVPVQPIELIRMIGSSVLFGLIWPTLPVILILKTGEHVDGKP